jgi:hypothetical protein
MSSTSTTTSVYTLTQTATHLTDVIMGAIADILGELRIDLTSLYRDWKQDEAAIKAWIMERSLKCVVVECHRPGGAIDPVIEFPVSYKTDGTTDNVFTADRAAFARYRAKLDRVPPGTTFRLVCTFHRTASDQPGWSSTTRASTAGLDALRYGTLGRGPHGSVEMRYLHS